MKGRKRKGVSTAIVVAALCAFAALAGAVGFIPKTDVQATGISDPTLEPYLNTFKGRKVAFVPIAMSIDLAQGWLKGMQKQAQDLGYEVIVRDPNWNTDIGSQAMNQLVNERPDVIVFMNPDLQSYAKILKRADAAGIKLLAVNLKSVYPTHYIGEDWQLNGRAEAEYIVGKCGAGTGRSGKVAVIQGILTSAASAYQLRGVTEVFSRHPEMRIVANQSANWDAGKARDIAMTVLQQHPDLCGIVGFWDGMDVGAGAAVREASLNQPVYVVTSGGGAKAAACDKLRDGTFSAYLNYDVRGQARDINTVVRILLQSPRGQQIHPFSLPTPPVLLTRETLNNASCWSDDDFR